MTPPQLRSPFDLSYRERFSIEMFTVYETTWNGIPKYLIQLYINYCKFFLKFPSYLPLARRCISWFIFSSNSSKIVLPLVSISQKVKTRTPTWRYFAILVPIFLIMNNENGLVAKNFKSMNENMTWKHRYNLFSDFS